MDEPETRHDPNLSPFDRPARLGRLELGLFLDRYARAEGGNRDCIAERIRIHQGASWRRSSQVTESESHAVLAHVGERHRRVRGSGCGACRRVDQRQGAPSAALRSPLCDKALLLLRIRDVVFFECFLDGGLLVRCVYDFD